MASKLLLYNNKHNVGLESVYPNYSLYLTKQALFSCQNEWKQQMTVITYCLC